MEHLKRERLTKKELDSINLVAKRHLTRYKRCPDKHARTDDGFYVFKARKIYYAGFLGIGIEGKARTIKGLVRHIFRQMKDI